MTASNSSELVQGMVNESTRIKQNDDKFCSTYHETNFNYKVFEISGKFKKVTCNLYEIHQPLCLDAAHCLQ